MFPQLNVESFYEENLFNFCSIFFFHISFIKFLHNLNIPPVVVGLIKPFQTYRFKVKRHKISIISLYGICVYEFRISFIKQHTRRMLIAIIHITTATFVIILTLLVSLFQYIVFHAGVQCLLISSSSFCCK